MRIQRHTSTDNCSYNDGDSHPKHYAATTHGNAFTNNHAHSCAEV